jgi:hypothetical protein
MMVANVARHLHQRCSGSLALISQAQNTEAEEQAREIRLRAERRCGQMLADREMAAPRGSNQYQKQEVSDDPTHPKTLPELGISRDQSSQWQKLAAVPEPMFEAALAEPNPTTSGISTRWRWPNRTGGPLPRPQAPAQRSWRTSSPQRGALAIPDARIAAPA